MDNDIDHCIICYSKETQNKCSLSARLNSRLEYVTGPLPDLGDLGSILENVKLDSPADMGLTAKAEKLRSSPSTYAESSDNLDERDGTISAPASPNPPNVKMPVSVILSLETFYVLKLVLQHPLDHVTIEVMMLLVQSPSDWFEICPSCRIIIREGIELVNILKAGDPIQEKAEHVELTKKLDNNLYRLRNKFLTSMFQRMNPVSWEFPNLEDYSDVSTINFLMTEEEAVCYFRRILLTTALPRVVNLVNSSKLVKPVLGSTMNLTFCPANSRKALIDLVTLNEDQSEQKDGKKEDEIGQPDWLANSEDTVDTQKFSDCLNFKS